MLDELQAVLFAHRARGIDDKRQSQRIAHLFGDLFAAHTYADQPVIGILAERRRRKLERQMERVLQRRRKVRCERVHEFLRANLCRLWCVTFA